MNETLTCLFFQLTDSDTVLILNIIHVTIIADADKKLYCCNSIHEISNSFEVLN